MDENNSTVNSGINKLPLYERPGRLDPDRHVPIDRSEPKGINVHYDNSQKGYLKDNDTAEFTEQSVNAMDPFEDSALLNGDIKPRTSGVKTGASKFESKIFVPEIDTSAVKKRVRRPVVTEEPEQPVYIADEDRAAASDYVADAMSGVETEEEKKAANVPDITRLKMYVLLLGVVVVLEIAGIALLALL